VEKLFNVDKRPWRKCVARQGRHRGNGVYGAIKGRDNNNSKTMSLDWRTIFLVVLILTGLFWQEEIRKVLLSGWDLLLSGIVIPPFEETFEVEPMQIVLPEPSDEAAEKWTGATKIGESEEKQEIGKETQGEQEAIALERDDSFVSSSSQGERLEDFREEPMGLSEIQVEVDRITEETAVITEEVNQLVEREQRLAEMQELINEISQTIETVSQETVKLVDNSQVG